MYLLHYEFDLLSLLSLWQLHDYRKRMNRGYIKERIYIEQKANAAYYTSDLIHECFDLTADTIKHVAGLANSQIASSVFTLGTVAVLPFYTLMVVAPKAELVSGNLPVLSYPALSCQTPRARKLRTLHICSSKAFMCVFV